MNNKLLEKYLASGELPPACPYLRGYYCLGRICPKEVSGEIYACEDSVYRYRRLLKARARRERGLAGYGVCEDCSIRNKRACRAKHGGAPSGI